MENLLTFLNQLPTYTAMIATLAAGKSAAVTGLGQINRSHFIASVENGLQKPMLLLCPDDMATRRLQEELHALLGYNIPILPTRELTLHDTAVVSRAWEQKRLRLLYDFAKGNCKVLICVYGIFTFFSSISTRNNYSKCSIYCNNKAIVYNIGDFIFNHETKDTGIFQLKIDNDGNFK